MPAGARFFGEVVAVPSPAAYREAWARAVATTGWPSSLGLAALLVAVANRSLRPGEPALVRVPLRRGGRVRRAGGRLGDLDLAGHGGPFLAHGVRRVRSDGSVAGAPAPGRRARFLDAGAPGRGPGW